MRRLPLIVAALFGVGFVGLPLLAMLIETVYGPSGFSLAGYGRILENPADRHQLWCSMQLGACATAIALLFGGGHAFLTTRTDLPGARWLGPLGIAPLALPPILIAMGFADLFDVPSGTLVTSYSPSASADSAQATSGAFTSVMSGFWACAALLGIAYAPFVAVLTARGLRATDGRAYEAALLARGRLGAERMLFRMATPEILAGCLFAFVFVVAEHGVPEFLTVKGKNWHTYAEGVFARWTRRATGTDHEDLVSPIVAALPLLVVIAIGLAIALRLRAHTSIDGRRLPLPIRPLGALRWPSLLLPLTYLGAGVVLPVVVMVRWAAGSTQVNTPMSIATLRQSFRLAIDQAGGDLGFTIAVAAAACVVTVLVALPLARAAARRAPWIDPLSALPIAVPAILLAIGMVHVFNSPWLGSIYAVVGDFYDSVWLLALAYAARLLPFGILTLSHATRRQSPSMDEAALLTGRSPAARFFRIQLPLLAPACWSVACLVFVLALRELDMAVVLPAGNGTVVRRLSNIVHFGGEDMGGALALLLLAAAVLLPAATMLIRGKRLEALS